jgi:outer membrane receptor protein involved in Fe transport
VFGNNLTDKAYRVASYRIDVTGGNILSFMAPPRTWGVQIGVRF